MKCLSGNDNFPQYVAVKFRVSNYVLCVNFFSRQAFLLSFFFKFISLGDRKWNIWKGYETNIVQNRQKQNAKISYNDENIEKG